MRAIFLVCIMEFLAAQNAMQISPFNYTAYANQTLVNATAQVNAVNESGYLIFYPNLTSAYADLQGAQEALNTSPTTTVALANRAVSEADAQYRLTGTYRNASAAIMVAFVLALALVLGKVMRPAKRSRRNRRG